jgi:hypothetical protein
VRSADDLLDEKKRIPATRYYGKRGASSCVRSADDLLDKIRKSWLHAIPESGELLPVCGQLFTYLIKKENHGSPI